MSSDKKIRNYVSNVDTTFLGSAQAWGQRRFGVNDPGGHFEKKRPRDLKISGYIKFWVRIQEIMSDFWSDDSFPVKTGSWPTAMVDLLFDAEYPNLLK